MSWEEDVQLASRSIRVFSEKDPAKLDWSSLAVQVVVESTGRFTNAEDAKKHLRGTVRKVQGGIMSFTLPLPLGPEFDLGTNAPVVLT